MKVLLTQDVKAQGKKGEIIDVKDSYARNVLLRNGWSVQATPQIVNETRQKEAATERRRQQELEAALARAKELHGKTAVVRIRCGENGKPFGAVTSKEIADELVAMGYEVDKKKVVLKENLKFVGNYDVELKLYPNVSCTIVVSVQPQ